MTSGVETGHERPEDARKPTYEIADDLRNQARKHIEKRQGLQVSLLAFVVINAFVVGIWAVSGSGYFWPGWLMAAWGVGLIFQIWDYFRRPVTEADVDDEIRRMQRR